MTSPTRALWSRGHRGREETVQMKTICADHKLDTVKANK